MLKMKSIVAVRVNGRDYELYCEPDSPYPDALEANSQISAFLFGRYHQSQQKKESEEKSEPS